MRRIGGIQRGFTPPCQGSFCIYKNISCYSSTQRQDTKLYNEMQMLLFTYGFISTILIGIRYDLIFYPVGMEEKSHDFYEIETGFSAGQKGRNTITALNAIIHSG